MSYITYTASQGTYDGAASSWTIGGLSVGASSTLTLVASVGVSATGTLINNAYVFGDQPDSDPNNNHASAQTAVTPVADLAVVKSAGPSPAYAGGLLTYTIVIANNGPSPATGVTVTDPLPSGVTYAGSTASQGSFDSVANRWNAGPMGIGASATLTLVVSVDQTITGTILI